MDGDVWKINWPKVKSIDFEEIQDRMNVKECVEGLSVLF